MAGAMDAAPCKKSFTGVQTRIPLGRLSRAGWDGRMMRQRLIGFVINVTSSITGPGRPLQGCYRTSPNPRADHAVILGSQGGCDRGAASARRDDELTARQKSGTSAGGRITSQIIEPAIIPDYKVPVALTLLSRRRNPAAN